MKDEIDSKTGISANILNDLKPGNRIPVLDLYTGQQTEIRAGDDGILFIRGGDGQYYPVAPQVARQYYAALSARNNMPNQIVG